MTMWLCLTSCFVYFNGSIHQEVFLIVETLPARTKERLRNLEPRRFFESIAAEAMACRHHLKLGDFAWVLQPASPATPAHCLESVSMSLNHCPLVNLLVERKRIADLVGRSAVGDHLKQLRRMEDSALQHLFFLIEGNLKHASNCTVYDTEMAEMESICLGSKEDIDAFCAKLIVLGSKARQPNSQMSDEGGRVVIWRANPLDWECCVGARLIGIPTAQSSFTLDWADVSLAFARQVGVLQTKDSAGTVRLLKNISAWLAWTLLLVCAIFLWLGQWDVLRTCKQLYFLNWDVLIQSTELGVHWL